MTTSPSSAGVDNALANGVNVASATSSGTREEVVDTETATNGLRCS